LAILSFVPRTPSVPAELKAGPFTIAAARHAGVTRARLRTAAYRPLGAGMYRWTALKETPLVTLAAVAKRLPAGAAFSGLTAAWLHGCDVEPCDPVEVTVPNLEGAGRPSGTRTRRAALAPADIVWRHGLPATSPLRTAVDLGGRNPLTEAVVALDLLLHAELVTLGELQDHVASHPGAKGVARLRRAFDFAEPKAESAMETRLRMVLVLARLPRPEVQVPIHDDHGRFIGRPDLLYRSSALAIDYDGANHRDRLTDDKRRQNGLVAAGFRLLRFTAQDVYNTPAALVTQVRRQLGPNGAIRVRARDHLGPNGGIRTRKRNP
jgi:very-short-patch-repair endonuclease